MSRNKFTRKRSSRKKLTRKKLTRKRLTRKRSTSEIKKRLTQDTNLPSKLTVHQLQFPVCWMASVMLLLKNIRLSLNDKMTKFLDNIYHMFINGKLGVRCPIMPRNLAKIYNAFWPTPQISIEHKSKRDWLLGSSTISSDIKLLQAVIQAGGHERPDIYYIDNLTRNWEKILQSNIKESKKIDIFLVGKDYQFETKLSQIKKRKNEREWFYRGISFHITQHLLNVVKKCPNKIKGGLLMLLNPEWKGSHLIAFFKHKKGNYFCNTWGRPCEGLTCKNINREFGKGTTVPLIVLLSVS